MIDSLLLSLAPPDSMCGGTFYAYHGTISSPGFPETPYDNDITCTYVISPPANAGVRITFTAFNLQQHDGTVCLDVLQVTYNPFVPFQLPEFQYILEIYKK